MIWRVTLNDSRVPREYLLAVTFGRIAVVGTKVFKLSPLSINRSNRLARLDIKNWVFAFCVCRSIFASTEPNNEIEEVDIITFFLN